MGNALLKELDDVMRRYEELTNTHEFDQVGAMIAEDARYWFSDGSYEGLEAIRGVFERNWNLIREEVYSIRDIVWVAASEEAAACTYAFHWKGLCNGAEVEGGGRGTNVLRKKGDAWVIVHEHLSVNPA